MPGAAPSASIVVPTRDRAGYLDVALDSIAPQARAAGAEVIVVDDASRDRRRVAEIAARHDADGEVVWGANLAIRRRALDRLGPFEEGETGAGDEEEWVRRYRGEGGRIRYVAAAGLDHRRAGRDARLPGLAAAAYRRGRTARRYDERRGQAPPPAAELRTLAGCAWHTVRRRCANGPIMAAHTVGRIAEALDPAPDGGPDFL